MKIFNKIQKFLSIITLMFIVACVNKKENSIYDNSEYLEFLKSSKSNSFEIWESYCITCHNSGIDKIGIDQTSYWRNSSKNSLENLYENVYNGYEGKNGIMPKRGACYECSEQDLKNSIFHLFFLSDQFPNEDN